MYGGIVDEWLFDVPAEGEDFLEQDTTANLMPPHTPTSITQSNFDFCKFTIRTPTAISILKAINILECNGI